MALVAWLLGAFKVVFGFALGWIKGGRVFILLGVATAVSFIAWAFSKVQPAVEFTYESLTSFEESIRNILEYLNSLSLFGLIYHAFALDTLLESLFSISAIIFALLGFMLASAVVGSFLVIVPFFTWRVTQKLLTSVSGGLIKT